MRSKVLTSTTVCSVYVCYITSSKWWSYWPLGHSDTVTTSVDTWVIFKKQFIPL